MCGIIGEISKKRIDIELFIKMRDRLIHRGPDADGLYQDEKNNVVLGHRRLSIIDLSKNGNQPMSNETGTIWITYNGEIFNFIELRDDLINRGHIFKSKADTEVIIHGYEEWGIEILKKLRGQFAFGIWDENKKLLFIARDRIGLKPLYYYHTENQFIFASELKAIVEDPSIKREIDANALKYYFKLGYIPSPLSIWKDIKKLPHGSYLLIEDQKITKFEKYWRLSSNSIKKKERIVIDELKNLLEESTKIRLISDVPVGVLLSGGIDSSLITTISHKYNSNLTSFTINIEPDGKDDQKYIDLLVKQKGLKNITSILHPKNINNYLDKILYHYDEPFGISSIFPTFLLMETIHGKIKVVLSGDGGDEIFAGYNWYQLFEHSKKFLHFQPIFNFLYRSLLFLNKYFIHRIFNLFKYYFKLYSSIGLERYRMVHAYYFDDTELTHILGNKVKIEDKNSNIELKYFRNCGKNIKDLQYFDIKTYLVDHVLVKVDRASMAYSIEVRVPYIDHILIEYLFSLDSKLIFKHKKLKYLLKKIARNYLPKEIINRPKKGFGAPLDRLGFINTNLHILENSQLVKDGIIKKKYVDGLFKILPNKLERKVWLLILLEMWYRKWK